MAKKLPEINVSSYDNLFSTEEERQEEKLEKIIKIPINEIHDFKNHPFPVRLDEEMQKLIDSIKENGQLVPVLVRPSKYHNGYEMISGHRRKFSLEQIGIKEIDVIVRDLDDDQATIIMVDSNIQRENILPTERGYAYKMKLEAMKHQGKRTETTSSQLGTKLTRADSALAEQTGESRNQIQRYIRLTYLNKPLQTMVDGVHELGITIALNPAYELSFLTSEEQDNLADIINSCFSTPSLAQAQEFKKRSRDKILDNDFMKSTLLSEKPNQKEKLSFKMNEINSYFPKHYTPKQKKDLILKLLKNHAKKLNKENMR